jgi:hypothetical protein
MGAPNGPFEWAEERYRLASLELTAARTEVDAFLSVGELPSSSMRRERALGELLAAQMVLPRLNLELRTRMAGEL